MKKQIQIFSLITFLAISNFSCKKYLDVNPQDVLVPSQYYQTEAEINAAIAGVYSSLAQDGTYGRNMVLELEMGNDEAQYNNRNNNNTVPAL